MGTSLAQGAPLWSGAVVQTRTTTDPLVLTAAPFHPMAVLLRELESQGSPHLGGRRNFGEHLSHSSGFICEEPQA
jgi:hypothetical protein